MLSPEISHFPAHQQSVTYPDLTEAMSLPYLLNQHIVVDFDVDVNGGLGKGLKHLLQQWNAVIFSFTLAC